MASPAEPTIAATVGRADPTPSPPVVAVTLTPSSNNGGAPESMRGPASITKPAVGPTPPANIPTSSVAAATKPATPEAAAHSPSLEEPRLFINRELSWLAFNQRVLDEGRNQAVPLVERLKFLAILAANLDEFFMVRVAGLRQQLSGDVDELPADGMSVPEQLAAITAKVRELVAGQYEALNNEILPDLARHGFRILQADELSEDQRREVEAKFWNDVFPILTPLAIDPGHPFPHLRNNSLNIAVAFVRDPRDEDSPGLGVVQVPTGNPRLVALTSAAPHQKSFILLEDILALHVGSIFPMQRIEGCWPFRVTRNWDLAIDEEEG
ncbi:MAG: RNA degradosome polyphosphate kinase, partial [Polyangiales bacterium]